MRTSHSNQFPVKPRHHSIEGVLWYYPFDGHKGQRIMIGKWRDLETERKRLSCMGYKYENFKKRNL